MRILYHHRTLADGAEGIHIAEMIGAFRHLGHQVDVCSLAQTSQGGATNERLRKVKSKLPSAAFELASIGSNALDYARLWRSIRERRPDLLYKRHARFDIGALVAARQTGIPTVLEVNCLYSADSYHRYEPVAFPRVARYFERHALRLADVVVAVSTPLARQIDSLAGVDATVLPNGVDPERFDDASAAAEIARARYGLDRGLTIGWTGVIRDWHGVNLLLDAVAGLPAARLLIVGDGPGRAATEARIRALGLTDRTVITGRIPHDKMPEHIAAMDIAVVAGDGTGVASPMKLLEYMAMGRAVVAPRLENITDVVTDAHNGLLFAPDDGRALASALHRLAKDPALRLALGTAARATIKQTRTWRRNAEQVLELVQGLPGMCAPVGKAQHV